MDLEKNFIDFINHVTSVNVYQDDARSAAKHELKMIKNISDTLEKQSLPHLCMMSMYFDDLAENEIKCYSSENISIKERYSNARMRLNRQYSWLLVDIYEKFEDYVEYVYAYLGKNDVKLWRNKDYKKEDLSNMRSYAFPWYLERARRIPVRYILERLREIFPKFKRLEINNFIKKDLKVAIECIEKIRHSIVHCRGKINDVDVFFKKFMSDYGLSVECREALEYKTFIYRVVNSFEGENYIMLLDVKIESAGGTVSYYSIYDELVGYLVSVSALIYNCVSGKPVDFDGHKKVLT